MGEPLIGVLQINYVDGQSQKFEHVRETDTAMLISRLQDAIKQTILFIKLENKLLAIPFYNIKSIEVSPPPSKLLNTTIVATRQF
jgi:hypothetical protein